eukprot:jgi/Chlat1/8721/Chrsp9S08551
MAGSCGAEKSYLETPTYYTAALFAFFLGVSLILERALEHADKYLKRNKLKGLRSALRKMRNELMLVGFISLLLAASQQQLEKICVSESSLDNWTPCSSTYKVAPDVEASGAPVGSGERRLLATVPDEVSSLKCSAGKGQMWSTTLQHQAHIFIFLIAVVHILYSCITMIISVYKVRQWMKWEHIATESEKNEDDEHEGSDDEARRAHVAQKWGGEHFSVFRPITPLILQFVKSFTMHDYLHLRREFCRMHVPGSKFKFHRYLMRSVENDFARIVGVSVSLWMVTIIYVLLDAVWQVSKFIQAFVPLALTIVVGWKLSHIVQQLAVDAPHDSSNEELMKRRDQLFWFQKPKLLLHIMEFIIFQNAYQVANILFDLWQLGASSCLFHPMTQTIVQSIVSVVLLIYVALRLLPVYTMVVSMGSNYNKAIFSDHVHEKLMNWAHKNKKAPAKNKLSEWKEKLPNIPIPNPLNLIQAKSPMSHNGDAESVASSPGVRHSRSTTDLTKMPHSASDSNLVSHEDMLDGPLRGIHHGNGHVHRHPHVHMHKVGGAVVRNPAQPNGHHASTPLHPGDVSPAALPVEHPADASHEADNTTLRDT